MPQPSSTINQTQLSFVTGNVSAPILSNPLTSHVGGFVVPSAPPLSIVSGFSTQPQTKSAAGTTSGFPNETYLSGGLGVSSAPSSGTFVFHAAPSENVGLTYPSSTASIGLPPGNLPLQTGSLAPASLQSTVSQSATAFLSTQSRASTTANLNASTQAAPLNSLRLSTRMYAIFGCGRIEHYFGLM